ncbi:MAG TPA: CRISPR system precrRNA processing endoribonuclease RAMP protein Cas6 [Rhodospirillales bacterium]|nr:CRISPR system precrRNA processing endoribonuclease RAMP protein Cas6 [Rhodospirillales bacterium]
MSNLFPSASARRAARHRARARSEALANTNQEPCQTGVFTERVCVIDLPTVASRDRSLPARQFLPATSAARRRLDSGRRAILSCPPRGNAVPDAARVIPLDILDLHFVAESEVAFGSFPGSAWRGALGHSLKRLVCIMRRRPCEGCAIEVSCLYTRLFEPRSDGRDPLLGRVDRAPQPFVLDCRTATPCRLRPGDPFLLRLVLIGRETREAAVYLLRAVEEAARHGIGPGRGRLRLAAIELRDPTGGNSISCMDASGRLRLPEPFPMTVPPAPERVRILLEAPLRMRHEGALVGPGRFTVGMFLMNLVRRQSLLARFHGDGPPDLDFRALRELASRLEAGEAQLAWREQLRRSARQATLMRMGGLVGRFELDLRGAEAFWPFLWRGQFLHAGKATSMGLGRYRLEPLEPPGGRTRDATEEMA